MAAFNWKYLLVMFLCQIGDAQDSKHNQLPHEIKCMDAACKDSISQAWTKDSFETAEEHFLSFKKSELIEVQGKPTDLNKRLWLCKIFHSGERGFISEDHLKEVHVFEPVPPELVLLEVAYPEIKQTKLESTAEGTGDQVLENPGEQEIPEIVVTVDQADANPAGDLGEEKKDVQPLDNEGHTPSAETGEDLLKQNEQTPDVKEEPQQSDPTSQTHTSGKDETNVGDGNINMVQSPGTVNTGAEGGDDVKVESESPEMVDKSVSAQTHDKGHGDGTEKDGVNFSLEGEKKELVPETEKKSGVLVGDFSSEGGEDIAPNRSGEGEQSLVEDLHPVKEADITRNEINSKEKLKEGTFGKDSFMQGGDPNIREEVLSKPQTKHSVVDSPEKVSYDVTGDKSVDIEIDSSSGNDKAVQSSESKIGEEGLPKPDTEHLEVDTAEKISDDIEVDVVKEDNRKDVNMGKDNTMPEALPKAETEHLVVNSPEKIEDDLKVDFINMDNKIDVAMGKDNTVSGSGSKTGEEALPKPKLEHLVVDSPDKIRDDMKVDVVNVDNEIDDRNTGEEKVKVANVGEGVSLSEEQGVFIPQGIPEDNKKIEDVVIVESRVDGSDPDDQIQMREDVLNIEDLKEGQELITEKEPNVEIEGANPDVDQIKPELNSAVESGVTSESSDLKSHDSSDLGQSQDGTDDLNLVKKPDEDEHLKINPKTEPKRDEKEQKTEPKNDEKEFQEIIPKAESDVEIEGANPDVDQPKLELDSAAESGVSSENSDLKSHESSDPGQSQDETDGLNLVKNPDEDEQLKMKQKIEPEKDEKEVQEIIPKTESNVEIEGTNPDIDQSKIELKNAAEGVVISESSDESSYLGKSLDETDDLNAVEEHDEDDHLKMIQNTEPNKDEKEVTEIINNMNSVETEGTNAHVNKHDIDSQNVPGNQVVTENSDVNSGESSNFEESQGEGDGNNLNFLTKRDEERTDGNEGVSDDGEEIVEDEIGGEEKKEIEKDEMLLDEKNAAAEKNQQNENREEPKFDAKEEIMGDKKEEKGMEDVDKVKEDLVGKTDGKDDLSIKLENQEDVEKVTEKENEKVETDADARDDRAAEEIGEVVEKPSLEIGEKTEEDEAKISDPGEKDDSKIEGENNHQPPGAEINPDNNFDGNEKTEHEEEVKALEEEEQMPVEEQDSSKDHPAEEISRDEKEQVGEISPEGNVPSDAENLTPTDQLGVEENGKLKDSLDQPAVINEEYDSGIEEDLDEEEGESDEEKEKEEVDEGSKEVITDGQDSSAVTDESVTDKFQNQNPDEIQPTPQFEVIDGTTIYFDDDSDFTFDQGNTELPGDQLQPSPSMSTNQGPTATPPLPADALNKDEGESEKEKDTFLSNTDDLAIANVKFSKWLTVAGNIDILFDELAAGNPSMREDQPLLRETFNAMMNDPEWKKQIMKKLWHHFSEDESVKDMFGSYDGDDEMDDEDYFQEERPQDEDPYDPARILRETSEAIEIPGDTGVFVDPYNFNSEGGEDVKQEEEKTTDYHQEEIREDGGIKEDPLPVNEKTEDTTQTPQLQTDYPPPLSDYPELPEGFSSYTEAPETDEGFARNFSLSMDEMAEMLQTNMKALYHVFSEAVIPLVAMLPDEMKEVLKQPTFFGIAWTTLVWLQIGLTSSLFLLFCGCACCARRSRAHQKELLMEIDMITEQKAKALDALKTTTKHFSDQNLEYFNYQQLTKDVEKEKEELKTLYEELKEEKERQDEKYTELENMNIQLQEELDSFKQKVQHHGSASDKAKNQMQKMQKKINELEAKLQSHRDDALSLRQDIDSLTKENKDLSEVKVQLSDVEVNTSDYAEGQMPLGSSADSLLLTSDVKEHTEKLEALTENVADLETENKTLKETVSDKDNEIEVLKDCLVQLKGLEDYGEGTEVDNEARIQQLLDVNRANAKITLLEDERKAMEEKMEEEARKIHNLEDDNRTLRKDMETIQQECKKAKEDHEEARTKLDVLTEYFKGKEVEMQRKLGKEEALKFHSQKELDSLGEKTAAAEAEVANYKQQIQDLKDEIEKSERSFRQQIAAHEKKAHESWMASRTAERKLKETNKEVASLRQRLSQSDKVSQKSGIDEQNEGLTELQGRKTTDASPLIKPSPERMGSPSNVSESSMLRRDQPSRNSILEDAPSPPMIGGQRHSPSDKDRPPSRPVRVSRSGRPPSFHEDFFPPEEMMPPPDAMPFRGPPGGFHPGMDPYGPPPPMDGYMPPDMNFDGPPGPPPPDMGYGPPGPYDFGPRGPPPPSMGGDPRFPPPFMGPHPDDFPPDGPYGAMDPGMGIPPPFRGPPPDWNDRVPHPSMRGPPPPGSDPRTSRPVSRGGPPPPSHIQPDQVPRSSTPVESGEPQNQGAQNQNRRTSNVQP